MYIIYYCNQKIKNNIYDIRIHKKEKNTFLHKYSLIDKGVEKELWENNVRITISKDKREFY